MQTDCYDHRYIINSDHTTPIMSKFDNLRKGTSFQLIVISLVY